MIVKREKYYTKSWKRAYGYNSQKCKRTSYFLFGFIPVYIKNEVIGGDYE